MIDQEVQIETINNDIQIHIENNMSQEESINEDIDLTQETPFTSTDTYSDSDAENHYESINSSDTEQEDFECRVDTSYRPTRNRHPPK